MNYTELKEKTDQYVETFSALGPARGHSRSLLNGFLWWLYPQMKDEDLPTYGPSPLEEAYKVFRILKDDVAELYRMQHPEDTAQVDSDGPPEGHIPCPHPRHPLEEPDCPLCKGTGVVTDTEGYVNCPRCG